MISKRVLIAIPFLATCLTSCGVRYYNNKFFSASLLKKEGIPNLPKPEGKLVYEKSTFDKIINEVYVQNEDKDYPLSYAQRVYDYLMSLSFKYYYSVSKPDFLLTWELDDRAITCLEDCKYQSNIHVYYLFCSNKEPYLKEDNNHFYIDGIGIVINISGGSINNYKKDFHFDLSIELDTNERWDYRLLKSE